MTLDKNQSFELSEKTIDVLKSIVPYDGDKRVDFDSLNLQQEIDNLSSEISRIDFDAIKFDKTDYYFIFALGILDIGISILFNNSASELNRQANNGLFSTLDSAKEGITQNQAGFSLDILKDIQEDSVKNLGKKTGSLFSEVFQIPNVLKNWATHGVEHLPFRNMLGEFAPLLKGVGNMTIAIFYLMLAFLYVVKIFGLTIPGLPIIVPAVVDKSSLFIKDLLDSAKSFVETNPINFSTLMQDGLEVLTLEVAVRIYCHFRYTNKEYSTKAISEKRNKLLLTAYSTANAIGIGKFAITGNPLSINPLAVIRCVMTAWKVIKDNKNNNELMSRKLMYSSLKNQYETLNTLICLDKSIFYAKQLSCYIENKIEKVKSKQESINYERDVEIEEFMKETKKLNQ